MDNTIIAQALLQLSASTAVNAEHAAETDARAAGLHLPLPQFILSGTHHARVLPYQFRAVVSPNTVYHSEVLCKEIHFSCLRTTYASHNSF